MHLKHLQDSNERCRRDSAFLWSKHSQKFAGWLKEHVNFLGFFIVYRLIIIYIVNNT